MTKQPHLIVHIGAGKTGTSSIQAALERLDGHTGPAKAKYLGMFLELAQSGEGQNWQQNRASFPISWDNADLAARELVSVLGPELDLARAAGYGPLIWSNEAIFERPKAALIALRMLRQANHVIQVQCYVRRHDAWALSAYAQWGLKHKGHEGPLVPFSEWKDKYFWRGLENFRFFGKLRPWSEEFGKDLKVFNFDARQDVTRHFFEFNGLEYLETPRRNATPSPELLAGYALFNQKYFEATRPEHFASIWNVAKDYPDERLGALHIERFLPSDRDLQDVRDQMHTDRNLLNELLVAGGEPAIDYDTPVELPAAVDPEKMSVMLAKLWLTTDDRLRTADERLRATKLELAEVRRHPFALLREWMRFRVLCLLMKFGPVLSHETAEKLARSARKRDPDRSNW